MNYGIGPTWMHSVNCMLLPTLVIYDDGAHRRERFSIMLRFLWWGIGVYVYEKE